MSTFANAFDQASAEILPHFSRTARSPAIPESAGRIILSTETPRLTAAGPCWPLRGSFRVAYAGGAADPSVLHRIVVALTSDASHVTVARHAARDSVLFDGDVVVGTGDVSGYFNVDLADLFVFTNRQDTFHIIASIGTDASDVLTCAVQFPWIESPRAEPIPADSAGPEDESEGEDEDDDDSWMVDEDQDT